MSVVPDTTDDLEAQSLGAYRRRNRLTWSRNLQENARFHTQLSRTFPPYLTVAEVEDQLQAEASRLLRLLGIRMGTKAHRDIMGTA